MSYNDDQVRTKLNSLSDTQESIEQVGQWVLFHRRHAARTATLWAQYLESAVPAKRLILVYLANEVVQVSRSKKKEDFHDAFTPIIASSMATAYSTATRDVQGKLRRVVSIWGERAVFSPATIAQIETRFSEIDKGRSGKKSTLGGSLADASAASAKATPSELSKLATLQTASTSAALAATESSETAQKAYAATPADASSTSLPAHSAHLSKTLRSLESAAASVQASLTARNSLLKELQSLVDANSAALKTETDQAADLDAKKDSLGKRKRDAEDAIIASGIPRAAADGQENDEYARPEMEALTPPAIEGFTPPPEDIPSAHIAPPLAVNGALAAADDRATRTTTPPGDPSPYARSFATPPAPPAPTTIPGLSQPQPHGQAPVQTRDPRRRPPSSSTSTPTTAAGGPAPAPPAKRRKVDEDAFGSGLDGLDADVVGMLD